MRFTALVIACLSLWSVRAQADTVSLGPSTVEVRHLDLDLLFDQQRAYYKDIDEIDGYRIQITASSDRMRVYRMKGEVYQSFARFKSYLVYQQPYYKLRIGDFTSRIEARRYLEEVMEEYPEAIIVPDRIKVNR